MKIRLNLIIKYLSKSGFKITVEENIVACSVRLFNKNADKYDLSFINILLNKLGGNYEQISHKNLKAKITKTMIISDY